MTHQALPRRPEGGWQSPPANEAAMTALGDTYGITFTADQMRLLITDRDDLGIVDRRRRYILGLALEPVPCPHCHTLTCRLAASTFEFSYTEDTPDDAYKCPSCGTRLAWHVALIGGGQWFTSREPLAAAPTPGQYNPLDLDRPPLAEAVSQEYPMGRRIGQPGDPIRVAVDPPRFTAGQPVEFMDRPRGAEWEPGTFVRYDAPGSDHPAGPLALVTGAHGQPCRTEVTRIRAARCICEGRGGHINPACPWYGTDQDGGA